jgi:hypothetical protein
VITEVFPVGSYPVTNELMLSWAAGISRSFVPLTLWTPFLFAFGAVSGWMGLRELRVPRLPAALGVAALFAVPTLMLTTNGPGTELPSLAWLVSAAGLCAASVRRPGLLAPAIVAAGLGAGTKTTTVPLAALALGVAMYASRGRLRSLRVSLLLAAAAALGVGGVWYIRNLVQHGSPLWPFVAAPWGDPVPTAWSGFTNRFLTSPVASVEGRVGGYLDQLGGSIVLLAGGLAAPLLSRGRAVLAASAALVLALLLWANAPLTGKADDPVVDFSLAAVRYLLPATAVAVLALALSARRGGWRAAAVSTVFAVALGWSLVRDAQVGYPYVPSAAVPLVGAALGAGAAQLAAWRPAARLAPANPSHSRGAPALVWVVLAAAVAGVALSAAASGFVQRHATATPDRGAVFDTAVTRWLVTQPDFRDGSRPIALAPTMIGPLAGDRLQHRLQLIRDDEPCARVEARARRGWVVLGLNPFGLPAPRRGALRCFEGRRPVFEGGGFRVFGPGHAER